MGYDLLIIFTDGTRKEIQFVTGYGIDSNSIFYYEKNGYRGFLPKENIMFFGRKHDYEK